MTRRISSLQNSSTAASRVGGDVDSRYDVVKVVSDNIDYVEAVAEDMDHILRYVGTLTAPPATRVDGSPIKHGDYYINSHTALASYYSRDEGWVSVPDAVAESIAAEASAVRAQEWASNPKDVLVDGSKHSALHYADAARASAAEAADSASAILDLETTSKDSAELAGKWAEEQEDVEVAEGKHSALHHATKASADATLASASAALSEANKNKAMDWAEKAVDVQVEAGQYSAKHHAAKAGASAAQSSSKAGEASVSASAAANSATAAGASKDAAITNANNASASAVTAGISESNAATSEANAAASASTSGNKAAEAEISASNAAGSASAASTSAAAALASEGAASDSATSAAAAAAAAAGSETNAAASETNASTSESRAASSAAGAATSEANASTYADNADTSASEAFTSKNASENAALEAKGYRDEAANSLINTYATNKEDFFALAEKRKFDNAGSGFAEWGKTPSSPGGAEFIAEGLSTLPTTPNTLRLGGNYNDAQGTSRNHFPVVHVGGVASVIRATESGSAGLSEVSLPPAPDGTETYDSATGVVTQHGSPAEAFEGQVTNGDFRNGLSGWSSLNNALLTVTDGVMRVAYNGTTHAAALQASIPATTGTQYTVEVVCRAVGSGIIRVDVDNLDSADGAGNVVSGETNTEFKTFKYTGTAIANMLSIQFFNATDVDSIEVKSISILPVTEQVVTSRQDYVFLEQWYEKVSDKDQVYPLGNVQYTDTTWKGIALATRDDGYTRFGDWDTTTTGNYATWSNLSDADKIKFLQDPENNIYNDDGELVQVRYRVRVVKGLGDKWGGVSTRAANLYYFPTVDLRALKPCGKLPGVLSDLAGRTEAGHVNGFYASSSSSQYPTDAPQGDNGIFVANNGSASATFMPATYSYNGLCVAVPIALVQRRNQGAYHPVYNPEGCARWWNEVSGELQGGNAGAASGFWYNVAENLSQTYPATALTSFTKRATNGNRRGTIGGQLDARPDGKAFDAIYASDVQDLRMSSRDIPLDEIREDYTRKAIAGKVKGFEGVPFLRNAETTTTVGTMSPYFVKAIELTGDYSWLSSNPAFPTKVAGTAVVNDVVHKIHGASFASNQLFLRSRTLPSTGYAGTGHTLMFGISEIRQHAQTNPTWTDIMGDPDRVSATFPDGVEGEWNPDSSAGTKDRALLRKAAASGTFVTSSDLGASWTSGGVAVDAISNTARDVHIGGTNLNVWLIRYETPAHFTEDADNSEVLSLGEASFQAYHAANLGGIQVSSLIGKVPTSSRIAGGYSIEGYLINNAGFMTTGIIYSPKHNSFSALESVDSPTVKTFNYLASKDGVATLQYVYKEMIYDTTWGDNNQFEITDGQSILTDDNGNTVLYGTASFPTQYFIKGGQ